MPAKGCKLLAFIILRAVGINAWWPPRKARWRRTSRSTLGQHTPIGAKMSIGDGLTARFENEQLVAMPDKTIRRGSCNRRACSCNEEQYLRPYRKENNALRSNVNVFVSPQISGRSLLEIVVCAECADPPTFEVSGMSLAHASDRSGLTSRHKDCRRQTQASQSVAA